MGTNKNKNIVAPLVSIIMSVYNTEEAFLKESIESILKQTYTNFEFLIVDDCSNEKTKKCLSYYEKKDGRIKIFTNKTNIGLTKSLNFLIAISKGDYLARADGDDLSRPERLERQVDFLTNHPDCVACGTNYYTLIGNSLKKNTVHGRFYNQIKCRLFFENSGIMHASVMMKKSVFNENGILYNENIRKSQDFDLWVRTCRNHKMHVLHKRLSIYRINKMQISRVCSEEQLFFRKQILLDELLHFYPNASEAEKSLYLSICLVDNKSDLKKIYSFSRFLIRRNANQKYYNLFYFKYYLYYHLIRVTKFSLPFHNFFVVMRIWLRFIAFKVLYLFKNVNLSIGLIKGNI